MKGDKLRNKKLQNYVKRDKLCTLDGMLMLILFVLLTDKTVAITRKFWVPVWIICFTLFFILFAISHRVESELKK